MMTTQITKPDFTGQELFVGIDVSKNSWKVCILTQHIEHKTFTQPPKPEVLVGYLQRHFPGATYHWTLPHLVDTEKSQYLPEEENWHGFRQET
jgi:hypothetical protein